MIKNSIKTTFRNSVLIIMFLDKSSLCSYNYIIMTYFSNSSIIYFILE